MPTEPRRQEKLLGTNARLPEAVTEEQRKGNVQQYFPGGTLLLHKTCK